MASSLTVQRRGIALALLAVSQFVVVLDGSIVNVALPSIGRALHFSEADLPWVINAYVLTLGGFLLLGGRLADLLGRRRLFIMGLTIFGLASLGGALSQSATQLVIARAAQGLGGALLSPAALALLTTIFAEGPERNRALGVWGAVAGSSGAAGVLLGGILTSGLGWQWVLLVNVPVALVAAALAVRLLPEARERGARRSLDIAGAVAISAGLSLLVYALVDANRAGWGSVQTVSLLILAAALMVGFVAVERRSRDPLVPFRIFRTRSVAGGNSVGLLVGAALFSMFFFLSLYMQQVLGYDSLRAGVAYLPLALTIAVSAGLAAQLVARAGVKPVLVTGLTLVGLSLIWLSRISVSGNYVDDVLFPSILAGLGLGLSFVPLTLAAVGGVSPDEYGLASGLIGSAQQVGAALGLAILSSIATARTSELVAGNGTPAALASALTAGFQWAFLAGAGLTVIGIVAALILIRRPENRAAIPPAAQAEAA